MVSRWTQLEAFHLECSDDLRAPTELLSHLSTLSANAPQLHELTMKGCSLLFDTPLLGLTRVHLSAFPYRPSFSLGNLLNFMSSTPMLETVRFEEIFQMDSFRSSREDPQDKTIPLVHLQKLTITDNWFGASVLIPRLELRSKLFLHGVSQHFGCT
jgi:hypothetical protein